MQEQIIQDALNARMTDSSSLLDSEIGKLSVQNKSYTNIVKKERSDENDTIFEFDNSSSKTKKIEIMSS